MNAAPADNPASSTESMPELRWKLYITDLDAPFNSFTVSSTMRACAEEFHFIDFSSLTPDKVHPVLLATALRSTFSSRDSIASWRAGLLCCIDACALRGHDARSLLRGLL